MTSISRLHGAEQGRALSQRFAVRQVGEQAVLSSRAIATSFSSFTTEMAAGAGWDAERLLHNPVLNSRLDNLHRDGAYLESACPHCGGEDRFFAGPKYDHRIWSCRQCGSSHTTAGLLGLSPTIDPFPVVRAWQDDGPAPEHLEAIRAIYGSLYTFAQDQPTKHPHAQEYLAERGIPLWFALQMGLGYIDRRLYCDWFANVLTPSQPRHIADAGLPVGSGSRFSGHAAMFADGYQGKILFSYFDDHGNVVDLRTRSISPKDTVGGKSVRYTSPKGKQPERGVNVPFGVDTLGDHQRIILTEGEFKRLVPTAAGLTWPVLSLPGANDPVQEYLPYFRRRFIVLAFDNDDKRDAKGLTAGESATVRIGRLLRAHDIEVAVLDPSRLRDQKGIDDFVLAYGIKEFSSLVAPGQTLTLSEYEAKLIERGLRRIQELHCT